MAELPEELRKFIETYPDTEVLDIVLPDMCGVLRGKQVPFSYLEKFYKKGINIGGASNLVDIKGGAADSTPLGSRDGDPDKRCFPIPGTLAPVPWAPRPTAQIMGNMINLDGSPYFAYPRNVLEGVIKRLDAMGLKPTIALEYEFFLLDASEMPPKPAKPPIPMPALEGGHCYLLEPLYDFHEFISEVDKVCQAQNIPATSCVCEYGDGQFEINLNHVDNVLLACDQAILLKRAIKGVARRHGLLASFMAKPFAHDVGSGLHAHISVLDTDGNNIFEGKDGELFSDTLRHAIGGVGAAMAESMAIFAPNANSYRRFQKGAYVPLTPNWGPNHRGVALRIPVSDPIDSRFEHRVSGADANPYLVTAAILAGMMYGIENKTDPGPMTQEEEILEEVITLPNRWSQALDAFEAGTILPQYFGEEYHKVYGLVRRDEEERIHSQIADRDYEWYLRTI